MHLMEFNSEHSEKSCIPKSSMTGISGKYKQQNEEPFVNAGEKRDKICGVEEAYDTIESYLPKSIPQSAPFGKRGKKAPENL